MGDATVSFTPAQLELVINHLVDMMAHAHFRALPTAEQTELQQRDGFTATEHFASKMETIWGVYMDVFKSSRLYGANLANLPAVQTLIDQIVKRDRLPSNNSLEAQQSLRDAWNIFDECIYSAAHYKLLAKATYVLCLLLGTLVIILTVFKAHIDGTRETCAVFALRVQPNETCGTCEVQDVMETPADKRFTASACIFTTASLLIMVTGMNTFYDPSRRWRELRAIAESLQSDVFAFRTRTGPYIIDRATPRGAEQRFVWRILDARVSVVQLAGLAESAFTRQYKGKVYSHGQNEGSSAENFDIRRLSKAAPIHIEDGSRDGRIIDNHHSPMLEMQHVNHTVKLLPGHSHWWSDHQILTYN
jgi:hypothetical protein